MQPAGALSAPGGTVQSHNGRRRRRVTRDYHVNIFYGEADDGYIADIPDLRACSAFGDTSEEALKQVEIAKAAWLEAARFEDRPIPQPMYWSVIYQATQIANPIY
jgi:predicted RNase H-like HicB family nuclease